MNLNEAISKTLGDFVIDVYQLDNDGFCELIDTYEYNELSVRQRKHLGKKEITSINVKAVASKPSIIDKSITIKPVIVFCVED